MKFNLQLKKTEANILNEEKTEISLGKKKNERMK